MPRRPSRSVVKPEMPDSAGDALYDSACELLHAAQCLLHASERAGCEAALAPTLGCLAEALKELAHSTDELCRRLVNSEVAGVSVLTASESLDALTNLLSRGGRACDDARAAAAAAALFREKPAGVSERARRERS